MAAKTPDVGTGTAIAFATSFLAKMTNGSYGPQSRDAVPTSTMATTTADTFMPRDRYDPGEIRGTIQFATDASPPILNAAETITITWPDAETLVCSGFMTSHEVTFADEELMTADVVIKLSGAITF